MWTFIPYILGYIYHLHNLRYQEIVRAHVILDENYHYAIFFFFIVQEFLLHILSVDYTGNPFVTFINYKSMKIKWASEVCAEQFSKIWFIICAVSNSFTSALLFHLFVFSAVVRVFNQVLIILQYVFIFFILVEPHVH